MKRAIIAKTMSCICAVVLAGTVYANGDSTAKQPTDTQSQTSTAGAAMPMQHMQTNMAAMQALMARIHAAKDPKERQKLLEEHHQMMQSQMQMMHGMMGAMGGGMGMGMKGQMKDGPANGNNMMTGEMMRHSQGMMMQRMDMMQGMMEQMMEHMSAEHGMMQGAPAKQPK